MCTMAREILEWPTSRFMETHPDAARCPEELTLEGKLVWFCEPRDVGTDQSPDDVPVRVF